MNLRKKSGALPLFWKIYIACMILASFRMGDADWEWPSSGWHSYLTTETSAQKTPVQNIEAMVILPVNVSH